MALRPDAPPLTKFKLLAFDIFGTVIDEEIGIYKAMEPLLARFPRSERAKTSAFEAFLKLEASIHEEQPSLRQRDVLSQIYTKIANSWGVEPLKDEVEGFADSMGEWPPYPDTVAAMQKLAEHYKLVALSNCDRAAFSGTLAGPLKDVRFDAVYLAEDIGSYKPDPKNFEYLLSYAEKEFGAQKEEVLMVAHGLGVDHVTTKDMGIHSAFIKRRTSDEEEKTFEGRVAYQWRWDTLGDFAAEVEKH
ncbi:MAG: hypothetical protein Q9212_004613 [Teloschistes hypoglaucus]